MPLTYHRDEDENAPDELPEPSACDRADLDQPIARPLLTYSDEELLAELELRYKAFVFFGTFRQHDDRVRDYYHPHGDYYTLLGLAHHLLTKFNP